MMDIRAFASKIRDLLERRYPYTLVAVQEVPKNNGTKRTGISIINLWDNNKSCTVYLEGLFDAYQKGKPLEEICQIVMEESRGTWIDANVDINSIKDFSAVKGKICYQLVNAEKNANRLKEIPHRLYQDLAVIYYILLSDESDGMASITVRNYHMLDWWGVDEAALYEAARHNTPIMFKVEITPMEELIREITKEITPDNMQEEVLGMPDTGDSEDLPFYVVTNERKCGGAIVMLYDGVMENFAKEMGSDFYILPSSIHETMFLPVVPDADEKELLEMVRRVNEESVSPEDVLSDNMYIYHADSGYVEAVG